jgi:hypothetical protein
MPKYDFDPDLIVSIVLGDLSPENCPGVKIIVRHQPVPFKDEVAVGLTVEAGGDPITAQDVLSLKRVAVEDVERTVWSAYHGVARKMSRWLYEKDPRIGLSLAEGFPNCPLFDPPYLAAPIRNYLQQKGGDGIWKKQPETVNVREILTTCPFCKGSIYPYNGSRRLGVWCGGNLGFVHEDCAPWVTPRS